MSVQAISWVLDHSPARGAERLVLIAIANHAGDDGTSYPGIATIAAEANVDEKTVKRALGRLIDAGMLGRIVNGAPDERIPRDRRPNLYTLHGFNGGDNEYPPRGGQRVPNGGDKQSRTGGTTSTPKPSPEPSIEPSSMSDAFGTDAARLCELLADLIEGNGSKRPTVNASWLTEADRMLRIDKRDPEHAERLIRWCQTDPFWRSNVLSMAKFRAKYDQLRLRANAARRPSAAELRPLDRHMLTDRTRPTGRISL